MRWVAGVLAAAIFAAVAFGAAAKDLQLVGTASYRERIALPPGAVFEAILEDVSVADAPALELGRITVADPGTPPFAFKIVYDPAKVEPEHAYSVRAQVSVGRKLMFVSDTMNPVLTRGAGSDVDITMIKVGETAEETRDGPSAIGAHGLRLPATFAGMLPCAACESLSYQVNLWPDQVFHLRRDWKGKDILRDTVGRWSVDPDSHVLILRGAAETWQFSILGPDRLKLVSHQDEPVPPGQDYFLTAGAEFAPFDPHLPLRGMLTYVADQAQFTECLTGRDYPLIKDGDYEALEHAYLAAGAEAAGPIMASFDGAIIGEPAGAAKKSGPGVMVERFVGIWPGETCERTMDKATLTNTYWKILRLGDTEITVADGRREPNLILREGAPNYTATVGCNQLVGSFDLAEDKLSFGSGASTMMACPPPLDAWEAKLALVLNEAAGWRIDGQTLELLDVAGKPLALFQAVYLY